MIGQTVSHYKILEQLGGGGMGVVYKAQDLKLDRAVALKFLPPDLTRDPEAKQRFVQEAKAASALDHTNICNIHEIGETEDGQLFIVMACYEGETLKKRIERGALPLNDALDILVQVAMGLSKAHEHGIVHRDIKPANIIVTDQGEVKILDFGLAKLSGMTMMTRTGSTVGTVAYMSPEQARGEKVDLRTDLWSLGVMFYQMVTGELPFRSDYEQALIYEIMHDEPKRVREIRKDLPENIELIIGELLAKVPSERYASAEDLLADLLAVRENSSARLSTSAIARRRFSKRGRRLALGITALTLVAAIVVALFVLPKRATIRINPNHGTRVLLRRSYQLGQMFTPETAGASISRDGNWVGFEAQNDSGQWGPYFMNVAWNEPRRVSVPTDVQGGLISPDGAYLACGVIFVGRGSDLRVVSTSGGEVKLLEDKPVHNVSWHPNGSTLGYCVWSLRGGFWNVNRDGTDKRLVFVDSVTLYMNAIRWSPDGESVAFIRTFPERYSELMTRDLRTGREQQLTFDRSYADEPFWMSNGYILFSSARSGILNVWAIPERGGEPVQVTTSGGRQQYPSASGDGKRLLFVEADVLSEIWVTDLYGANARQIKLNRFISHFAMAPDFSRFVFIAPEGEKDQWVVYVADKDGSNRRRIAQIKEVPSWGSNCISRDGNWLAYVDGGSLYAVDINNPGSPKRICARGRYWWWSEKGDLAVLTRDYRMMQYSVHNGDSSRVYYDSTAASTIFGGKYLTYWDYRKGHEGAWIVSLDRQGRESGRPKKILPLSQAEYAIGSRDDHVVLYEKTPGRVWRIRLPECKEEYVGPASILKRFPEGALNIDGTQGAYIRNNVTQKLILMENVFE